MFLELRYWVVSIISGFIFGTIDALINANPYARKLYSTYKSIMRKEVKAGIGLIMAFIYVKIAPCIEYDCWFTKGVIYGLGMFFFRVVMYAATQYVMFEVSVKLVVYILVSGCVEMIVLGVFYGYFLERLTLIY